jgi:hypothetical protein
MKFARHHRQIRWILRVGLKRTLIRLLYRTADAIGFCVAMVRIHVIPAFQQSVGRRMKPESALSRSEPALTNVSSAAQPPVDLREEMLRREQGSDKIYTYSWAVSRLDELDRSGVADPVAYFNNEMTDWWLAPNGMMEQEADFLGIAVAIEERWYK